LNQAVGDAWNKGLQMAQGEIFGWIGSDDTYQPDAVRIVVDFFQAHPDAYFVCGDLNHMNGKGELIERYHAQDLVWEELINDFCAIPTPSAFYRREVIEKIGKFNRRGNDLEYWIRVARVFKTCRVDQALANFRAHRDSQTGSPATRGRWKLEDFLISLRSGGSLFSPRSKRFYNFVGKKLVRRKPSRDKT